MIARCVVSSLATKADSQLPIHWIQRGRFDLDEHLMVSRSGSGAGRMLKGRRQAAASCILVCRVRGHGECRYRRAFDSAI